ncbi:pilus assembly protein TadG-related protein [Rhizobium sp. YTU87027]|uniref:TadE/TadG family type IV pilus assembly protein n=1 Tax=Rhizobium sp. YTU87027 TaxID=3417741 RepID=UPI003D698845
MKLKHVWSKVRSTTWAALLHSSNGNVAISFALVLVPMLLAVGASIDYVRAYNVQAKMQSDLDAALLAAIKEVDTLDEDKIQKKVETWFAAQTDLDSSKYSLSGSNIKISKTNKSIQAVAAASVATTFMRLANIDTVNVSVASSVAGPATSFMNVYVVLDKSASMLLAATTAGQTSLRNSAASCEFACHTDEGQSFTYKGTKYSNVYDLSKAMGITLRADVSVAAVKEVLTMIDSANKSSSHVKVGLYTIGATATEVLAPTYSTATALKYLSTDSMKLNSATSEDATYFDVALAKMASLVGTAGDGSSASQPLKLVLLLTDGVQSTRDWVINNPKKKWLCTQWSGSTCIHFDSSYFPYQLKVSPLNPKWCDAMKTSAVTIGVLYTEYLSIPKDWGYNMTVGETMKSSGFASIWGGTMRSDVSSSTTRRDYIPYALKDCASSEDLFLSASDSNEIESGLSSLFQQYLTSVRLTQ